MIPQILHIIRLGDADYHSDRNIQSWITHYPDWLIKLWDASDITGNQWQNARNIKRMATRDMSGVAELMKWEILYREGGIVIDTDMVCVGTMPEWIGQCEMFAAAQQDVGAAVVLATDIVGSVPNNPFLKQLITDIEHDPYVRYKEAGAGVGAQRFNEAYQRYKYSNLTVLPSHFFYPRYPHRPAYTAQGPVYAYKKWQALLGQYRPEFENVYPYAPGPLAEQVEPLSITIGIPVWNSEKFIAETLRSALEQDYPHLEILLLDDGSTDQSADIIASFNDSRLRYIKQENGGEARARNAILQHAKSPYILWLDSDDILMPGVVSAYAKLITVWPEVAVFNGGLLRFDSDSGKIIEETHGRNYFGMPNMMANLFKGNFLPNPGTVIRTSMALEIGGYDENLGMACDYDFWLRVAGESLAFMHVGQIVCKYRWHQSNMSQNKDKLRRSELQIIYKMLQSYPLSRICSDLDWRDADKAEKMAYQRMINVLSSKGDQVNADHFRKHLAMLG